MGDDVKDFGDSGIEVIVYAEGGGGVDVISIPKDFFIFFKRWRVPVLPFPPRTPPPTGGGDVPTPEEICNDLLDKINDLKGTIESQLEIMNHVRERGEVNSGGKVHHKGDMEFEATAGYLAFQLILWREDLKELEAQYQQDCGGKQGKKKS